MTVRVEFRLLGELDVTVEGVTVHLNGKQRATLGVLLLNANRMVSIDRIADAVWGERLPAGATARVRMLISELRKALGPAGSEVIVTRRPGYVLRVLSGQLDLEQFESHIHQAREAERQGHVDDAIASYDAALDLWRGPALADVREAFFEAETRHLDETRRKAVESRIELRMRQGHDAQAIPDLHRLIEEQPLLERPHAQLMLALYRTGAASEALKVYRAFRARLTDDLGVEPTRELRTLHERILRDDQELGPRPAIPGLQTVPRHLPAANGRLVGRRAETRTLDDLAGEPGGVVLVVGPAGVGKTALAVHWAHSAAERFPDGQLFLDMRGFDQGPSISLAEALPRLLRALGVAADEVPIEQDSQIALYRSLLADRQALVLLDNVATADQVRPLIPGGSRCLTLVTSRDRLGGLVALEAARRVTLDLLAPSASLELLEQIAGQDRIRSQPDAAGRLARLCGHLPLALRVAGARLADLPHQTVDGYAAELANRGRLNRLAVNGDSRSAVRAAFDLSYQALPSAARRMFRLLALAPAALAPHAAAALADVSVREAEDLLDSLAGIHLLTATGPGRFVCHPLLVEYAVTRAAREDSALERDAAVRRLMDFYLHTIRNLAARPYAEAASVLPDPPPTLVIPLRFAEPGQGQAWLESEWENVSALIAHATDHGPRTHAWHIVDALRDVLYNRRPVAEWLLLADLALEAARRDGDLLGQGAMHLSKGFARWRGADLAGSVAEYERALTLCRRAGSPRGEAAAMRGSGVALKQSGAIGRAINRYQESLTIDREVGNRRGEAADLNNLASAHLSLGLLNQAERYLDLALPLALEIGQPIYRALALTNLGLVRQEQGRFREAEPVLEQALRLAREIGSSYMEMWSLTAAGAVHLDAGQIERAFRAHAAALDGARAAEDRNHQVRALAGLARTELRLGRLDAAMTHLDAARGIIDSMRHREGRTKLLLAMAEAEQCRQDFAAAREHAERALELARGGYVLAVGRAHAMLAAAHLGLAHHDRCVEECEQAMRVLEGTGQRLLHARTLITLGVARERMGQAPAARSAWRRAHDIAIELGAPEAREAAALLA
jgi:DNA-binding SARP family transcriptional activator/Tfp pilus assembly protein PilF